MKDSIDWFGIDTFQDLVHQALALAGEVGEFCNIVKKVERGDFELNEETQLELLMEIADIFIYTCNLATILNGDLGKTYSLKREFNVGRFQHRIQPAGVDDSGRVVTTSGRVLTDMQRSNGEGE